MYQDNKDSKTPQARLEAYDVRQLLLPVGDN